MRQAISDIAVTISLIVLVGIVWAGIRLGLMEDPFEVDDDGSWW